MRRVSLVLAYYDNPGMLARQFEAWRAWPSGVRGRVRCVVVDDGSPRWPAVEVPRPGGLPELEIYRVLEDRPWHQDGARNLGVKVSTPGWLILTDMDHVPSVEVVLFALGCKSPRVFRTLGRLDAPGSGKLENPKPKAPHPNSYVLHSDLYWKAGGYDEDLTGYYGTDGQFRRQLLAVGEHEHREELKLWRFSRDVIPDASTTTLVRKSPDRPAQLEAILARKKAAGRAGQITVLDFEWERQL